MWHRRRIRGLLGTALTWGVVGAMIAGVGFLVYFRPWPLSATQWSHTITRFLAFVGIGALWGTVSGVAFGLAIWRGEGRRHFQQLSARRITLWGAIAGAAFPVLLYTPIVIARGSLGVIPFYSMLAGVSALAGAVCARAVLALAKRAPELQASSPTLMASPSVLETEDPRMQYERVP